MAGPLAAPFEIAAGIALYIATENVFLAAVTAPALLTGLGLFAVGLGLLAVTAFVFRDALGNLFGF